MKEAQEKNNVKLSVAENYRRDPMNRLVKALIDSGTIGYLQMIVDVSVSGGGYLMHGTGWRAKKSLFDMCNDSIESIKKNINDL